MIHEENCSSNDPSCFEQAGCDCKEDQAKDAEALRLADELAKRAQKLCMWIRHTVPEWTGEVDAALEAVDETRDAYEKARGRG